MPHNIETTPDKAQHPSPKSEKLYPKGEFPVESVLGKR
jgi:hypothetical protein